MTDKKRDVIDNIIEGIRQVIDEIDQTINPEKRKKRMPVPVPVPVRPDRRDSRYSDR